MPESITELEAVAIVRRVEALAQRRLSAMAPQDEPTFACVDCLDHGWIMVPCLNQRGKCVECAIRNDHEVARACWSCDPGISREAGLWYRFLYASDRRGNPVLIETRTAAYERAMAQMGDAGKRVRLALDSIIEREKASRRRTEA